MQKLQESVFSIIKTTSLSPAVFSFLQPSEEFDDKTPLGGILKDTKHGWLALGPKFCVVDLRTGLKVAARTFGSVNNYNISVTSVVELAAPLTENSIQLVISFQCEDIGLICIFHVNGSQILHCIQADVIVTELAICDEMPDGPFTCFDGLIMAGTKNGEVFAFDMNRAGLIQALKDISQGYENHIRNESNPANLHFLPLNSIQHIAEQRGLALENNAHLAILLNESSIVDNQYLFRNPDGTVRMKAKRDHIIVTVIQYVPQLGSLVVGYNFGAFQIWNMISLDLEFTSQVNVECLPVTHFGFQEPCDDPRAFCYLWVIFSVTDRFEEEEFPLAVMYSLTYQGKRMLSDTKYLYHEFSTATIRFQIELCAAEGTALLGGKCVSCHAYSVNSALGGEGEDSMLNVCQLVWECWGENMNSSLQYGMLLFDLDQWYKDQMPATYRLESNAFMSTSWWPELSRGAAVLCVRPEPSSVAVYSHATRLEEHFYPNSLQYNCICLNTSEACVLSTIGIQRQIISSMDEIGPTTLLNPPRLYNACVAAGLTPLYMDTDTANPSHEEQRRFLLSVALEARLSRFLKRCAHDWATGAHTGVGCTLAFLMDWCWDRAIELKENAKELTAPLFSSSALPDRNVVRCLEHCVQQLTQLTTLLDAVLTKCCNLVVPEALSCMEEKYKGIGCVSLYFQVVQWFLRVGLLPERQDTYNALSYPCQHLSEVYTKRRVKLNRLQDNATSEDNGIKSCSLLYIDQLIEQEFGGDRARQMWINGGSEWNGLYPPPSLYSLLRLYLQPEISEEQKHSLVLYLLVDYSMVYDEARYEAVIRRLMQFPTMFGLSNTAIKATQAFWHLDHRDFDFALDQLQCLTGNTLSDWQHNVVLSSLLAQKKTQAALQYLHVRKPAPIQNFSADMSSRNNKVNDHDKLDDWQSCCNLYLSRGLVFEALDVIRICVQNACSVDDKVHVLNFFFNGCRNSGHLSRILQISLTPFEEEYFIKYLEGCKEPQTSDILVMYYLQQARYLEAERYNNKLKHTKPRTKDLTTSIESLADIVDRADARDTIVEVVCSSIPAIANSVAHCMLDDREQDTLVTAPKPMSVYVQAKSPKNTFTYKSSFIQNTIENASETWVNKPKMRRGLKRALNIEDTPFICTPKLTRTKSLLSNDLSPSQATPPKRAKLDLTGTPRTPKVLSFNVSQLLNQEMATLLSMPEASPDVKVYDRPDTPHSILKIREAHIRIGRSSVDSRSFVESDDDMLDTASIQTHYSDSTNKHLRFTIPNAPELSTPSPLAIPAHHLSQLLGDSEQLVGTTGEKEMDVSIDSFVTTTSHAMPDSHPLESPPKKLATETAMKSKKSYKDTVRARRSLSISAESSLSGDPNTSIESIADIPMPHYVPQYTDRRRTADSPVQIHHGTLNESAIEITYTDDVEKERETEIQVPMTPKGRRGIRSIGESTPLVNRSRSVTPERQESPIVTPLRSNVGRSRSRTPDLSPRSSPLPPIPEQPKQEVESEPHAEKSTLSVPRLLRSRLRTPERVEKTLESPRLEVITESPTKSSTGSSSSSPSRRSLRSRSRTPDVELLPEEPVNLSPRSLRSRSRTPDVELVLKEPVNLSPRSLRSRSKTPEKLMSPKKEPTRGKKSLSRIVLEANTFAKTKTLEKEEVEIAAKSDSAIECTPMKSFKQVPSLMDVTLSPIVNKSVLQSSTDSILSETDKDAKLTDKTTSDLKLPAFTTVHETYYEKSVLHSYESSIAESSQSIQEKDKDDSNMKSLPAFTTINVTEFQKSVLGSYESSVAETSSIQEVVIVEKKEHKPLPKPFVEFAAMIENDFENSVLKSHQSSIAESSQDTHTDKLENTSLITNDSDVEMKDNKWVENQETAAVIQKEKEKIVEIEREINELEGDMSDDEHNMEVSYSSSDNGNEIVEVEGEVYESGNESESGSGSGSEDEEEFEEDEEEESENEDGAAESEDLVISIKDTDSEASCSDKQTDEVTSSEKRNTVIDIKIDEATNDIRFDVTEENADSQDDNSGQITVEIVDKDNKVIETATSDTFNQGQLSILTDDNSTLELDKSDVSLNYSDEKDQGTEGKKCGDIMEPQEESESQVIEINIKGYKTGTFPITIETIPSNKDGETMSKVDPIEIDVIGSGTNVEQGADEKEAEAIVTEETSFPITIETIPSNKDGEAINIVDPIEIEVVGSGTDVEQGADEKEAEAVVTEETSIPITIEKIPSNKDGEAMNIVDPIEIDVVGSDTDVKQGVDKKEAGAIVTEETSFPISIETIPSNNDGEALNVVDPIEIDVVDSSTDVEQGADEKEAETIVTEEKASLNISEAGSGDCAKQKSKAVESEAIIEEQMDPASDNIQTNIETNEDSERVQLDSKQSKLSRKRVKSTSSNKSNQEIETEVLKTPRTRKRTQSNASVNSVDQTTPENVKGTPSRRAKTPTSAEVRKIITRRMSREMSEKLEDSLVEENLTPKRRSTRSKSKNFDDNESVTSELSMRSDEIEKPLRKGKKSALATKPDLSVIPEVLAEENKDEAVSDYSTSRRLTRTQKALMSGSRPQSRASVASEVSEDVRPSAFDVQPIDRISLLNKTDFEGSPDTEELQNMSPESIASDASRQRRSQARAASESKAIIMPKAAKIGRRISVDIDTPEVSSPAVGSPARGRRASFTRACEALHTPKGRRISTDLRNSESPLGSPAGSEAESLTPGRRSARRASTQSNSSQSKLEVGKRSKKMLVIEESKDTKKK